MRKILFITLSTILLLAGLLYFNSNYRQEQVNIIYDNLPYNKLPAQYKILQYTMVYTAIRRPIQLKKYYHKLKTLYF